MLDSIFYFFCSTEISTVKPSPPHKNVFSMDVLGSRLSDIDREMKALSTKSSGTQTSKMTSDAINKILGVIALFGLSAITPLLNQHPEYVPIVLKLVLYSEKLNGDQSVTVSMPYAIHYRDGIPLAYFQSMEFAFAYDPSQGEAGFANLVGAMNDVKDLLQEGTCTLYTSLKVLCTNTTLKPSCPSVFSTLPKVKY